MISASINSSRFFLRSAASRATFSRLPLSTRFPRHARYFSIWDLNPIPYVKSMFGYKTASGNTGSGDGSNSGSTGGSNSTGQTTATPGNVIQAAPPTTTKVATDSQASKFPTSDEPQVEAASSSSWISLGTILMFGKFLLRFPRLCTKLITVALTYILEDYFHYVCLFALFLIL